MKPVETGSEQVRNWFKISSKLFQNWSEIASKSIRNWFEIGLILVWNEFGCQPVAAAVDAVGCDRALLWSFGVAAAGGGHAAADVRDRLPAPPLDRQAPPPPFS